MNTVYRKTIPVNTTGTISPSWPLAGMSAGTILGLADKPLEKAPIYRGVDLQLTSKAGVRMVYSKEHGTDYSKGLPLVTREWRIRDSDDVTTLQMEYRAMYERYACRTPYSQRLRMIEDNRYADRTGALCTYVIGTVCDYHEHDGIITRICLMSPMVSRNFDFTYQQPIDSHLWLMIRDMRSGFDYANPDDRFLNTLHDEKLHIGDMINVAARIRSYRDSKGRLRLGVGEWNPMSAAMIYGFERSDRSMGLYHVPRNLIHHMTIGDFRANGTITIRAARELGDDIAECASLQPAGQLVEPKTALPVY
ncbi:hypothetical protein [Bifidobacterium callitrichidarum]|uniref:Uncharacterized protein n=1 Tax=Bifidobacterium callitrichidarum TaxID=2052941 RepID=A0A2U2NC66_9BIFI|nr:hypothetical protein [Bifidobacterium callitrichidarum]PWG66746.1 hypothetical protein DF196_02250 [Bifidobacterium callitrichidarum]